MIRLSDKGKELGRILKKYVDSKDDFVAIMLYLAANQKNSDENYQRLINYIENHKAINYNDILIEVQRILDIL